MPPAPTSTAFTLGRRPALDGLRGVAVLAVMACHGGPLSVFRGGYLGVEVFFALSGFLVTALLLQEYQRSERIQLLRFYGRRALRLGPALLVMLGGCCLYAAFRTKPDRAHDVYRAALWTACYAANGPAPTRLGLLGHAWSLSLEGQFYLLWPLVLSLFLRLGVRPRVVAGLVVAAMAAAAATRWTIRADSLLAGCVVGLLAYSEGLPRSRVARRLTAGLAAAVLVGLGAAAGPETAFMQRGGFTAAAAAAALLVAALVPPTPAAGGLDSPLLTGIGKISYGLYLWHFPLLTMAPKLVHGVFPFTRRLPGVDALLPAAFAFAAAALSYHAVERPCLRWKNRLFPVADRPVPEYGEAAAAKEKAR